MNYYQILLILGGGRNKGEKKSKRNQIVGAKSAEEESDFAICRSIEQLGGGGRRESR